MHVCLAKAHWYDSTQLESAGKYKSFVSNIIISEQTEVYLQVEFQICINLKKRKQKHKFQVVESWLDLYLLAPSVIMCSAFRESSWEILRITALQDYTN